jgi:hypothetical protein
MKTVMADKRAAQEAAEILLAVLPKSEKTIHDIAYSFGLIAREVAIPLDQATDFITAWSERLRTASPDFKERYPRSAKPSQYRYQMCYAVRSAYYRTQEGPASRKFKSLTGKVAPPASFWDKTPSGTDNRPKRPCEITSQSAAAADIAISE